MNDKRDEALKRLREKCESTWANAWKCAMFQFSDVKAALEEIDRLKEKIKELEAYTVDLDAENADLQMHIADLELEMEDDSP